MDAFLQQTFERLVNKADLSFKRYLYDAFPDIKIVYSDSSMLELVKDDVLVASKQVIPLLFLGFIY